MVSDEEVLEDLLIGSKLGSIELGEAGLLFKGGQSSQGGSGKHEEEAISVVECFLHVLTSAQ